MKIDVVSASAGTGKTYRLSGDLAKALLDGTARPEGVVAITYTVKAAGELESRIRAQLLEKGRADLAARVRDGYIGTIHSVCQRLLREFALEAGLSPYLEPIPESERQRLFDVALSSVLAGREAKLNELGAPARDDGLEEDPPRHRRCRPGQRDGRGSGEGLRRGEPRGTPGAPRDANDRRGHVPREKFKAGYRKLQPKLDELALGTIADDEEAGREGARGGSQPRQGA